MNIFTLLVQLLSLLPRLTRFSFKVETVPDEATLATLVAGIDFSRMKELCFSVSKSSEGSWKAYRSIIDAIPKASRSQEKIAFEVLPLQNNNWGSAKEEQVNYYVTEIQGKIPNCTVVFADV